MNNQEEITGTLENWKYSKMFPKSLEGLVYNDIRRRFGDGTFIITSTLTKLDEKNNLAYTLNSLYRLGAPYQEKEKNNEQP